MKFQKDSMNNQFSNVIEEFKWRGSLKDYTTNADSILINEKITTHIINSCLYVWR